jgi:hypothetical protein
MIHIVFNEPDVKLLQAAMELDASLTGDILQFNDDLSVGPIENIYTSEGIEVRKEWWKKVLTGGDFEFLLPAGINNDSQLAESLIDRLRNDLDENVWIWAAQNTHDVCGYYWLLYFLKEFQGRIQILYLNNLPFINEKGNIFYPVNLSEILPKEFLKAKKLARDITLSEFEVDPDEWTKICADSKGLRVLEGGKKLVNHGEDYFDAELKKFIMPDWQKGGKVVNNFMNKSKCMVSEAFALWRLKIMIEMDLFEVQGKVEKMKDFDVKYKTKAGSESDSAAE